MRATVLAESFGSDFIYINLISMMILKSFFRLMLHLSLCNLIQSIIISWKIIVTLGIERLDEKRDLSIQILSCHTRYISKMFDCIVF